MEVKCKICGKKVDRNAAFKIVTYSSSGKKKNNYYCSEEEYDSYMAERQYKTDFYDVILQYFAGMKSTNSLPKNLFAEMLGVAEQHSWKEIYEYVVDDKEYLDKCMEKDFCSDWARAKYLISVFRNNVGADLSWRGEKDNRKVAKPIIKETNYDDFVAPTYHKTEKKKPTRIGLDDLI